MSDAVGPVRAAPPAAGELAGADLRGGRWTERRAGHLAGRWGGVAELRADLPPALRLTAVLALAGVPAGLLWWLLAPVVHYVVVEGQTIAVESTATEAVPGGDVVFTLVMAGCGLLGGVAAWLRRRHRGVTVLLALPVGTGLAGVLAWQLGEGLVAWSGTSLETRVGPADAALDLAALPALAVGPFVSVLVYVAGTLLASGEDIGRDTAGPGR